MNIQYLTNLGLFLGNMKGKPCVCMYSVSSARLMPDVKIAHSCFSMASVLQGMHLLGFPPGGSLPVCTLI